MEKIRNFVENMFLSLPDTPEVREAKAHILEGMTDRYEALLAQGKNGDEAFGVVAGEFGSMEELRQELGLSASASVPSGPVPEPDSALWEEYQLFRKRFTAAVTLGVVLCFLWLVASTMRAQLPWARAMDLHHIAFLSVVAAAVGLFVYYGIQDESYSRRLRQEKGAPAEETGKGERNSLQSAIMLAAVAVYLFLGFIWNLWHPGWLVFLVGAALCKVAEYGKRR